MLITKTKSLLLVGDNRWFRQALALFLDGEPDMKVVAESGLIGEGFGDELDAVDVVIVDLGSPDGEALAEIRRLRRAAPRAACMVLTSEAGSRALEPASEPEAAEAVLTRASSLDDIVEAVRRLGDG
jgi:DNA-binding NarL/FixJ family response regulator